MIRASCPQSTHAPGTSSISFLESVCLAVLGLRQAQCDESSPGSGKLCELCVGFFLAGPFVPVYFSRVSLVPVPPPCPLLCCGFVHITNWDVFFVSVLSCTDYRKSEVERSCKADGIKLGPVQFYGASHFNYLATGHPKI